MTQETIRYAIADTAVGPVLVAVSDRGLVAVQPNGTRATLAAVLPGATLVAAALPDETAAIARLIDDPAAPIPPLDLRGDEQERAVWAALVAIPFGHTVSYGSIAKQIGATAQEVGVACGANRVAIAVPCHRVVKADGGISGYRWGVPLKRRLLTREAKARAANA